MCTFTPPIPHQQPYPSACAPLHHLSLTNNRILVYNTSIDHCYCFLNHTSPDIAELEAIKEVLKSLPTLVVLCLQGNPLCSQGKPLLEDALRAVVPGLVELTL